MKTQLRHSSPISGSSDWDIFCEEMDACYPVSDENMKILEKILNDTFKIDYKRFAEDYFPVCTSSWSRKQFDSRVLRKDSKSPDFPLVQKTSQFYVSVNIERGWPTLEKWLDSKHFSYSLTSTLTDFSFEDGVPGIVTVSGSEIHRSGSLRGAVLSTKLGIL